MDRQLHISTCGIEEWDAEVTAYNRFESTPYRALDLLLEEYEPLPSAHLLDYGAGLGRVNLYLYHKLQIPGYGLEIHPDRLRRAEKNLRKYRKRMTPELSELPIRFISEYAEWHEPLPETNLFYFFNPFSLEVFRAAYTQIVASLKAFDRQADLILYYPADYFLYFMQLQSVFSHYQKIDLDWLDDKRECFYVYRHEAMG